MTKQQIINSITSNGMREWTDERVSQAMDEYTAELEKRVKELERDNQLKEDQRTEWANIAIKFKKRIEELESNFLKAINDLEFLKIKAEDTMAKAAYQLAIMTLTDYK